MVAGFKRAMGWCSGGAMASWSSPASMAGGGGCARARRGFYPFYSNQRGGGRSWDTLQRPGERDLAQGCSTATATVFGQQYSLWRRETRPLALGRGGAER